MTRNAGIWRGLALGVLAALSVAVGCGAPYPNAIVNSNGQTIRMSDVDAILADPDLNEDQKKDSLRALGITDEELLNVLLTES